MASINIFFHKYNSKFTKLSKAFSFILYFATTWSMLKYLATSHQRAFEAQSNTFQQATNEDLTNGHMPCNGPQTVTLLGHLS
jgi:hypothetical protein